MHFKLDENIPIKLKDFLLDFGHTSSTVFEEHISGIRDKDLIEICLKRGFVFITLDNDFSNIISYPFGSHCGIIVVKIKSQGIDSVVEALQRLLDFVGIKKVENAITIIEQDRIKIRGYL